MAVNELSNWTTVFVPTGDGGWSIQGTPTHPEERHARQREARRLMTASWDELSPVEQRRVLTEMEQIGRASVDERLAHGNRSPAHTRDFLLAFEGLVGEAEGEQAARKQGVDPRTTSFCLALEEERRRRLGEAPLPKSLKVLEGQRPGACRRMHAAEAAWAQEYERIFGCSCSPAFLMEVTIVIRAVTEGGASDRTMVDADLDQFDWAERRAAAMALRDHPTLWKAGLAYWDALTSQVLLAWAINKATQWGLWKQVRREAVLYAAGRVGRRDSEGLG